MRQKVIELAERFPRFGSSRILSLLRQEGMRVNKKAVQRIWKDEGLSLRMRKHKKLIRERLPQVPLVRKNEVWSMDFVHERLENGRHVRILGVLDAFTRECLMLKAAPTFSAADVGRGLEWLFLVNGKPEAVRTDNGPEFRALCLHDDVRRDFIQPGSPWQNGHIESFFGKLRDELLSCELFGSGAELQERLNEFVEHYNNHRPHSALGGIPPMQFISGLEKAKLQGADTTL